MADRVRLWRERVSGANKIHSAWEDRFNVLKLEDYYLGIQERFGKNKDSRIVNKCGPTLLTKMPALMFWNPRAIITPKGLNAKNAELLSEQAQLRQDMANALIADEEDVGFFRETSLAVKEAHSRFGIVEVGYTGDYVDNPNADKPALKDGQEQKDESGEVVMDTRQRILNPKNENAKPESIYVRRIPAATFRVSSIANNHLPWSEWCGYYEWVPKSDVEKNPYYKNRKASLTMKATGEIKDTSTTTKLGNDDDSKRYKDCLKLWKVWDLREKKRFVWTEDSEKFLVDGEPFKRLPFAWMRFDDVLDEWYPKPVMADWPEIQDEMNERREQIRKHARRFNRMYEIDKSVKQGEIEKLENGEDGTYIVVDGNGTSKITPIPGAEQDSSVIKGLSISNEDFREITRVGGEAIQNPDSGTATQAQIKETRLRVSEDFDRMQVSKFLGQVVNLMLWHIEEYMLGVSQELQQIAYSCTVDIESMAPVSTQQKMEENNALLGILSNMPMLYALLKSDFMLRRTLRLHGITSERDVAEFKQAGAAILEFLQLQAAQAQAAKGGGAGAGAPASGGKQPDSVGAQPPPAADEILQQLAGVGLGPQAAQ